MQSDSMSAGFGGERGECTVDGLLDGELCFPDGDGDAGQVGVDPFAVLVVRGGDEHQAEPVAVLVVAGTQRVGPHERSREPTLAITWHHAARQHAIEDWIYRMNCRRLPNLLLMIFTFHSSGAVLSSGRNAKRGRSSSWSAGLPVRVPRYRGAARRPGDDARPVSAGRPGASLPAGRQSSLA
ncbi:hypothetical protein [Amycolatopsis sp. NPDC059021]|uniref:hypothetical protein n=1 Tax=Amycolatopsis sp. NPDC059021 TaxID=3346704 RepID=UPI0036721E4B